MCADETFAALAAHLPALPAWRSPPRRRRPPFAVAALAQQTDDPILVVSASGREADDLVIELAELLDDPGPSPLFPSWRPFRTSASHPALTPSASAWPSCTDSPPPEITRCASSLRQSARWSSRWPRAWDLRAITLHEGDEIDFDGLLASLVEMAYERVDLVGRRGEFAVRGRHPRRLPDHRRPRCASSSSATRSPTSARSPSPTSAPYPEIDASPVVIRACRELLLTARSAHAPAAYWSRRTRAVT